MQTGRSEKTSVAAGKPNVVGRRGRGKGRSNKPGLSARVDILGGLDRRETVSQPASRVAPPRKPHATLVVPPWAREQFLANGRYQENAYRKYQFGEITELELDLCLALYDGASADIRAMMRAAQC